MLQGLERRSEAQRGTATGRRRPPPAAWERRQSWRPVPKGGPGEKRRGAPPGQFPFCVGWISSVPQKCTHTRFRAVLYARYFDPWGILYARGALYAHRRGCYCAYMNEERIHLRLAPEEKRAFGEAAHLSGLTLSEWLRARARKAAMRELLEAGRAVAFLDAGTL